MAAHVLLLLLLLSQGGGNANLVAAALLEEDQGLREMSSKAQVLRRPDSTGNFLLEETRSQPQNQGTDVAFRLGDGEPEVPGSRTPTLGPAATRGPDLGGRGAVHDLGSAPRAGLRLETGVGDVVSERTRGEESEDGGPGPRSRRRRSWLWNQFFVIEEYQGPEPVLIGRVSVCVCVCDTNALLRKDVFHPVFI